MDHFWTRGSKCPFFFSLVLSYLLHQESGAELQETKWLVAGRHGCCSDGRVPCSHSGIDDPKYRWSSRSSSTGPGTQCGPGPQRHSGNLRFYLEKEKNITIVYYLQRAKSA